MLLVWRRQLPILWADNDGKDENLTYERMNEQEMESSNG